MQSYKLEVSFATVQSGYLCAGNCSAVGRLSINVLGIINLMDRYLQAT